VSSRLDRETGEVTIVTPYTWAEAGHRLAVLGSAAEYQVSYSDWVMRLLTPRPARDPSPYGYDTRKADQALLEALRTRQVHPSLVEEPRVAA
jgi:hypothetical protein